MCFSATASFTASAVIGAIGVTTIKSCRSKNERWFASIPILFAIQQFSEGLVWLSFTHPAFHYFQTEFTWIFLFFAWIVWPLMLPISVMKIEPIEGRKTILQVLMISGMIAAIIGLLQLYIGNPIPVITSFHIRYELTQDALSKVGGIFQKCIYVFSTLTPIFISSHKKMHYFAWINLAILLVAFVVYRTTIPSTWCFFAALLSGIIYWVLQPQTKKEQSIAN